MSDATRESIAARFRREFVAYDRLLALADEIMAHNSAKLVVAAGRRSTQAVAALYAKARKSMDAIRLLASEGYGEDAMELTP